MKFTYLRDKFDKLLINIYVTFKNNFCFNFNYHQNSLLQHRSYSSKSAYHSIVIFTKFKLKKT